MSYDTDTWTAQRMMNGNLEFGGNYANPTQAAVASDGMLILKSLESGLPISSKNLNFPKSVTHFFIIYDYFLFAKLYISHIR